MSRPPAPCLHCKRVKFVCGRGLCGRCYTYASVRCRYPVMARFRRWTADEVAKLRRMVRSGRTWGDMGLELGRTWLQCKKAAKRRGWHSRYVHLRDARGMFT